MNNSSTCTINATNVSIISSSLSTSRNTELTSFRSKKELCDFSDEGIFLAKLGPVLVKDL